MPDALHALMSADPTTLAGVAYLLAAATSWTAAAILTGWCLAARR